jgi:hypothetical protein
MEQETGIRSLYDEIFRGLRTGFGAFYAEFAMNRTYQQISTTSQTAR